MLEFRLVVATCLSYALCSAAALRAAEPSAPAKVPARATPKSAEVVPRQKADTGGKPAGVSKTRTTKTVKLSRKVISFIETELLPTWTANDPTALLGLLKDQIARWSDSQLASINQFLADKQAPSVQAMLTDARIKLAQWGAEASASEPSPREAALLLGEMRQQAEQLLATACEIQLMTDPLPRPQSLTEFRNLLWDGHVQNNQLHNAAGMVAVAKTLQESKIVRGAKKGSALQKRLLECDFADLAAKIETTRQELNERGVELRVARVAFALRVLAESQDIKERFFAAYAVGIDGALLLAGFKQHPQPFGRETLNAAGYVAELESQVQRGTQLAGDLVKKSELLFAGMHWWRRARYGRGPEFFGLVKNATALASLESQVALLMPRVAPTPVDPAKNPAAQVPDCDRRHHYTWAWQTREFAAMSRGSSITSIPNYATSSRSIELNAIDGVANGRFY